MIKVFGLYTLVATKFVMAVIATALMASPIFADETGNPWIKRIYTDEDAPPEIRFRHLLMRLAVSPDETGDRGNRQLQRLGIKSQDIPAVRAYLESLYQEAQAEIDEGIWRLACHSDAESLNGLEIRVVYNSFDDIGFAVFAKYLAIASAELASKGYPEFLFMIDGYPGSGTSFTVTSTDHRYAWGDTNDGIQQNRAHTCRSRGERLGKYLD